MEFELLEDENDEPAYGFTHDGSFITKPRLCEAGMTPVDPVAYYGLTVEEADKLEAMNEALRNQGD